MKRNNHTTFTQMALTLFLLCAPLSVSGQSQNHTYLVEKVYTNASGTSSNETISYYDGLGRLSETVRKKAWISNGSTSGSIVSTLTYDGCGRPSRTMLPVGVLGTNGSFVSLSSIETAAASFYGDSAPYTEIQYDSHPLDRIRSEWGAGTQWRQADKKTSHAYLTNLQSNSSRNIKNYTAEYSGNQDVIIKKNGNHSNGTIRIEEITDEDGRCTSVFTDALGRTLLSRQFLSSISFADTYYCYDAAGRLATVLPPELSSSLNSASGTSFSTASSDLLKRYGFFYRYDSKGQLIAKKLPGADWNYYIYDKGGRLVYSQDGNQRERGEWGFVLSDLKGRECIRGVVEKTLSPFTEPLSAVNVFVQRNEPATDMTDYGYLPVNCNLHGADILSVTWYDDYSFLGNMDGIPSAASTTSPTRYANPAASEGLGVKYTYSGAGQVTGKWEKVLGETDDNIYLWTVLYYDIHGRVVQESHSSHRGGWQRTNTGYDFTDHPLKSQTVSNDTSAGSLTELYTYSYDAWGRPSTVTHKLDALSAVVLHNYEYDEAGRVISDGRNGDADLMERYSYNVRSWKTDIKVGGNSQQGTLGETFMEKLYYNTQRPSNPQTTVQWGGNVSATDWMAGSDGVTRRYDFGYDGMSRLTGAAYADDNGGAGLYNRSYSYDRNSNITAVTTPSGTVQMSYVGNHLNGNNYDYDANGNLTKDLGRSIASIDYNQLNLPSCVSLSGSIVDGELLLYSASGAKLEAKDLFPVILPGNTDNRPRTDYVGNLIYDKTSLKKVLVPGGYVEVSGTSRLYRFFVSDHLGGNRLVTDASGSILQTNHYDPYGQSLPAGAAVDSGNPYKFSGKEYDTQATSYDFGARYYTLSNPRWTTMDPLCEKYYSISPYAYCAGNPVNLVDPEGMKIFIKNYEYRNGSLYKDNGDIVDNKKIKGFVRKAYNALQLISKTEKGAELINSLSDSNYDFTITKSFESSFTPNKVSGAYALQRKELLPQFSNDLEVGSGGTIKWNPQGAVLPTTKGGVRNPTTDLAHELFHGLDASNGKLDDRLEDGIKRSEWQAVYNENLLREQLGFPLRTHYRKAMDEFGSFICGLGPLMLTDGQIVKPSWY